MKISYLTSIMLSSALLTSVAGAHAQDNTSTEWKLGDVLEYPSNSNLGQAIYTSGTNQNGVIFWCNRGRLLSGISLEPTELLEAANKPGRMNTTRVQYNFGDARTQKNRWLKLKDHNVVVPNKFAIHRSLYNAVVRGEKITINTKTYGTQEISFPKKDTEKFKTFRNECGLGKISNKRRR